MPSFRRYAILACVFLAVATLLTSCAKPSTVARPPTSTAAAGTADPHGIRADEVFAPENDEYLQTESRFYAYVARVVEPASAATKGMAKVVMTKHDGKQEEVWRRNVLTTRPASAADLKTGSWVIWCIGGPGKDGAYTAPADPREARRVCRWQMTRVKDDSELFRGVIRVSSGEQVAVQACRTLGVQPRGLRG